ncbi:hypothetical protein SEA_CHEESETOUCH_81 [Gordonia phage CheeseTouch]|nr:hypothetical protein HOU97_gp72 [Gordonia phage Kenna]AZS12348.1 hypothetical protein SEA_KENNA_72 [Gordonia phage Kenna]
MPSDTPTVGYVVLAKRPDRSRPGEFDYQPAGSVWPRIDGPLNHQAYRQAKAEVDPDRYGDVEYVIGAITIVEGSDV